MCANLAEGRWMCLFVSGPERSVGLIISQALPASRAGHMKHQLISTHSSCLPTQHIPHIYVPHPPLSLSLSGEFAAQGYCPAFPGEEGAAGEPASEERRY